MKDSKTRICLQGGSKCDSEVGFSWYVAAVLLLANLSEN